MHSRDDRLLSSENLNSHDGQLSSLSREPSMPSSTVLPPMNNDGSEPSPMATRGSTGRGSGRESYGARRSSNRLSAHGRLGVLNQGLLSHVDEDDATNDSEEGNNGHAYYPPSVTIQEDQPYLTEDASFDDDLGRVSAARSDTSLGNRHSDMINTSFSRFHEITTIAPMAASSQTNGAVGSSLISSTPSDHIIGNQRRVVGGRGIENYRIVSGEMNKAGSNVARSVEYSEEEVESKALIAMTQDTDAGDAMMVSGVTLKAGHDVQLYKSITKTDSEIEHFKTIPQSRSEQLRPHTIYKVWQASFYVDRPLGMRVAANCRVERVEPGGQAYLLGGIHPGHFVIGVNNHGAANLPEVQELFGECRSIGQECVVLTFSRDSWVDFDRAMACI